jgi:hypothetical protein
MFPSKKNPRVCGADEYKTGQWCMNIASKRMIGSGIPISQSKAPFPKPMAASIH